MSRHKISQHSKPLPLNRSWYVTSPFDIVIVVMITYIPSHLNISYLFFIDFLIWISCEDLSITGLLNSVSLMLDFNENEKCPTCYRVTELCTFISKVVLPKHRVEKRKNAQPKKWTTKNQTKPTRETQKQNV